MKKSPKSRKPPTLKQIISNYKGVCQFCLKPLTVKDAMLDHVQPKSKATDIVDIIPVHLWCNKTK